MVSCSWDNVHFWRMRGGSLRSCPVNLEEHHQMHFTDIMFQPGYHSNTDLTNRSIYASTRSGHLFEFHYKKIVVKRVWHLLPGDGRGMAINSLYLHEAFCVTGSDDNHEGAVTAVGVSEDGLKVLTGTSSVAGATARWYAPTLVPSGPCSCAPPRRRQLVTCSDDRTIRVRDIETGTQIHFTLSGFPLPLFP